MRLGAEGQAGAKAWATYIPVEPCEGLDHVEPMHVHDGGVDGELGPD